MKNLVAIVLGYKGINSTGLIRSLGMAGFYVVFASSYSRIESRYTDEYLFLPEDEEEKLSVLCDFLKKLPEKAAIFTGDDNNKEFIEKNIYRLSPYCYCPNAGGKLLEISDKTFMAKIAENVGLAVPANMLVDISKNTDCPLSFPVIVKPFAGYAGKKTDIQICQNSDEYSISREYLLHNGYEKVMIQSLLSSDNQQDICLMGFSLPDGTVKIPCVIRKIRSYPLKMGSLSFGHVENELTVACLSKLEEFVRRTGFVGIFDIDLIIADGVPYFIEINYRNGQNGYVSTAAGYNIPANWFRGMRGDKIDEIKNIAGLYYMDEHCDYKHILEKKISFGEWFKDLRKTTVFSMYCKGDQRPFLRQYVRIPERWKRKVTKYLGEI